MNWLARLKNQKGAETDATKPTKPSFVAFVAYPQTPFENSLSDFAGFPGDDIDLQIAEIGAARMALFVNRGLTGDDAQILADRLAARDLIDYDDRHVCLECLHLSGTIISRRCGEWRKLGISSPSVPADLADILQRCAGFKSAHHDGGLNHA